MRKRAPVDSLERGRHTPRRQFGWTRLGRHARQPAPGAAGRGGRHPRLALPADAEPLGDGETVLLPGARVHHLRGEEERKFGSQSLPVDAS